MTRRYKYHRMSGTDLSSHLKTLDLTVGQFSRLSGSNVARIMLWLDDREEIPHSINLLCVLLKNVPGTVPIARRLADVFIIAEEE